MRSVQAIVRQGPLFFEAPTVALWEYARHDLLGMMEVSYAPDMFIRSDYYGADEFFEIQGTRGFIWVTRLCGNLHVDLPPLVLYEEDGRQYVVRRARRVVRRVVPPCRGAAFVDALLAGGARPGSADGDRGAAARVRGVPGVEQAHARRSGEIDESVTPNGWPPDREKIAGRRRAVRAGSGPRRATRFDRRLIAPISAGITVVRRPGRAAAHHHAHVGWYPRTRLLTSGRACP